MKYFKFGNEKMTTYFAGIRDENKPNHWDIDSINTFAPTYKFNKFYGHFIGIHIHEGQPSIEVIPKLRAGHDIYISSNANLTEVNEAEFNRFSELVNA